MKRKGKEKRSYKFIFSSFTRKRKGEIISNKKKLLLVYQKKSEKKKRKDHLNSFSYLSQ